VFREVETDDKSGNSRPEDSMLFTRHCVKGVIRANGKRVRERVRERRVGFVGNDDCVD
jgi:hypothetical protein